MSPHRLLQTACWAGIVGGLALAAATSARADDCHPTFGEDAVNWVTHKLAQQSTALADRDFAARALNYQLLGRQDVIARSEAESADLQAVEDELKGLDGFKGSDTETAVRREQVSQQILAALYRIRGDLNETRHRLDQLDASPAEVYFLQQGLGAVGHETLLASLQEVGSLSAQTLGARYTIYVQVTVQEDGSYNSSQVFTQTGGTAGMIETVGFALSKYPPPVGYVGYVIMAAVLIYELYEADECQAAIDHQIELLSQANTALPGKLIDQTVQWSLYQKYFTAERDVFVATSPATRSMLDVLDDRWKLLFGANAARSAAAQTELTDVKIKALQAAFMQGDPNGIFKNIAITDIASDVQALDNYVAALAAPIDASCLNPAGLVAEEDGLDGLDFAAAQLAQYRQGGDFAPLFGLFDHGNQLIARARAHVAKSGPSAAHRACSVKAVNKLRLTGPAGPRLVVQIDDADRHGRPVADRLGARQGFAAFDDQPGGTGTLCVIVKSGETYSCNSPSAGAPYDNEFSHGSGNPESDVLWGVNDGGYGADIRALNSKIPAASANIDRRIDDLTKKHAAVEQAVPQWLATNTPALIQATKDIGQSVADDKVHEGDFATDNAPLIGAAKQRIADFVASPLDPGKATDLIHSVGGVDYALSTLPADRLAPGVPVLSGVSAVDHAYGAGAAELAQRIARERLKANSDLSGDQQSLASEMLDEASRLLAHGADKLVGPLLLDAASQRFAAKGALANPQVTVVNPDGTFSTVEVAPGSNLPANALLRRAEAFEAVASTYGAQSQALHAGLEGGGAESDRRGAVLAVADAAEQKATGLFYGGDVKGGDAAMRFAYAALDIATRFIPGVNWGRDVYEAVSGKDMFTGTDIGNVSRTMAVLGAVTFGVVDEAEGVVHAIDEVKALEQLGDLGMSGARATEILEAAKSMKADSLELTTHALEEMKAEPLGEISKSEVKDAIEQGTKWWHGDQQTIVAIENNVAPGEVRVATTIDIDGGKITTAYREQRSDTELAASASRYIRLTP